MNPEFQGPAHTGRAVNADRADGATSLQDIVADDGSRLPLPTLNPQQAMLLDVTRLA